MSVDSETLKLCNQWFIAVTHRKGSRWRNCLLLQRNWIYARYQDGTRKEAVKSGWSFTLKPKLVAPRSCMMMWTCTIRLNGVPHLFICKLALLNMNPKPHLGLGHTHTALLALTTGLDRGSTTYFSTNSIRSHCSRAAPVSNTACRRGGWAADLTKLKHSGIAIPLRVVHQLNSMRLLSKTSLLLFQETLERQREVIDHSSLHPGGTVSPGNCPFALKQHLPYLCIFLNQCLSKTFFKLFLFQCPVFLFPSHSLAFGFAGWKTETDTLKMRKTFSIYFSSPFCCTHFFSVFTLDIKFD